MTPKSIETVLAIYGASVSTLSILLGLKAHSLAEKAYRAAGPVVSIDWVYNERIRQLTVSVVNSGRSGVTIYDLRLVIMREVITRGSSSSLYFDSQMEPIEEIPKMRWWEGYESNQLPVRLAANSKFPVRVNSTGIGLLPGDIPLHELLLCFVAETPNRYEFADIAVHSYSMRHFFGLEAGVPVREHRPSNQQRRFPYWPSKAESADPKTSESDHEKEQGPPEPHRAIESDGPPT